MTASSTDVEKLSIISDDPFLALVQFRKLTEVERFECLFLKLFGLGRDAAAMNDHLALLNGTTVSTSNLVSTHLKMHESEKQQRQGLKVFGSSARLVAMYAVGALAAGLGVILSAVQIWEHLR